MCVYEEAKQDVRAGTQLLASIGINPRIIDNVHSVGLKNRKAARKRDNPYSKNERKR